MDSASDSASGTASIRSDGDGVSRPAPATRRRPIPRKGHKKSRAGCATCKKRKVKCDEKAPKCGTCERLGLTCVYQPRRNPAAVVDDLEWESSAAATGNTSMSIARPVQTTPMMFDMNDMRFFRHFLFEAYPSLPIDGFSTWQEVSKMSHEYDFLLHSMLGLGASHLSLICPESFANTALKHRVAAITSVREYLMKPNLPNRLAEATLGTMLSLTFQSAYMPDGMVDFLIMVRGCFLVGLHAFRDSESSIFRTVERTSYIAKMHEMSTSEDTDSAIDRTAAREFLDSLEQLEPLCRTFPELDYLAAMRRVAACTITDPAKSYLDFSFLWDRLGSYTASDFASFVDPDNHISRLVIIHLLALEFVMSRKMMRFESPNQQRVDLDQDQEAFFKDFGCRRSVPKLWIAQMMRQLPSEYWKYVKWAVGFVRGSMYDFAGNEEVWRPFMLSHKKTPGSTNEDIGTRNTRKKYAAADPSRQLTPLSTP